MRILRVVHRLYPPKLGGLSLYAHQLSRDQASVGHQVVALTTLEGDLPRYERRDGYEVYRFPTPFWPLENPITYRMLPVVLRPSTERFDLLHAHSHLIFTTNIAALRKQLDGIPFVVTNHGFRVERGPVLNAIQRIYLNSMARWNLRLADAVISFTPAEALRVVSLGVKPEKSIVIPNGVDTDLFRPKPSKAPGKTVIWVGRFVPEKGVDYLLEAMGIVRLKVPDAKLKLVGYGPQQADLETLTRKLGLRECVEFLGLVEQEHLAPILSQAAVFVLPSLTEGFPTTLLEAMACARPVIVTKGIGLEEVAGDRGLYVPLKSPQSLADAIVELLSDSKRAAKLGELARLRAEQQFSWKGTVKAVNALFESLVTFRRPSS